MADQSAINLVLDLDAKGLIENLGKSSTAFATLRDGVSRLGDAFGPVGEGFALIVNRAISASEALLDLTTHALEAQRQLDLLAGTSAIRPETVKTLQVAAEAIGATYIQVISSVDRIAEGIQGSNKRVTEGIQKLGLSLEDIRAKDPDAAFRQILQTFTELPAGSEKAALGAELFGVRASKVAIQAGKNFDELEAAVKRSGVILDETGQNSLREFGAASVNLKLDIDGIKNAAAGLASETFTDLAKVAAETLEKLKADPEVVATFQRITTAVLKVTEVVAATALAFIRFIQVLIDVRAQFNAFLDKLGLFGTYVKALTLQFDQFIPLQKKSADATKEAGQAVDDFGGSAQTAGIHVKELEEKTKEAIKTLSAFSSANKTAADTARSRSQDEIERIKELVDTEVITRKEGDERIARSRQNLSVLLTALGEVNLENAKLAAEQTKGLDEEVERAALGAQKSQTEATKLGAATRKEIQKTELAEVTAAIEEAKDQRLAINAQILEQIKEDELAGTESHLAAANERADITHDEIEKEIAEQQRIIDDTKVSLEAREAARKKLSDLTKKLAQEDAKAEGEALKAIEQDAVDAEAAREKEKELYDQREQERQDERDRQEEKIAEDADNLDAANAENKAIEDRAKLQGSLAEAIQQTAGQFVGLGQSFDVANASLDQLRQRIADTLADADDIANGRALKAAIPGRLAIAQSFYDAAEALERAYQQRISAIEAEEQRKRDAQTLAEAQNLTKQVIDVENKAEADKLKNLQEFRKARRDLKREQAAEEQSFQAAETAAEADGEAKRAAIFKTFTDQELADEKAAHEQSLTEQRNFEQQKDDIIAGAANKRNSDARQAVVDEAKLQAEIDTLKKKNADPKEIEAKQAELDKLRQKDTEQAKRDAAKQAELVAAEKKAQSAEELKILQDAINAKYNLEDQAAQQLADLEATGNAEAIARLKALIAEQEKENDEKTARDLARLADQQAQERRLAAETAAAKKAALDQQLADEAAAEAKAKAQRDKDHAQRLKDIADQRAQIEKKFQESDEKIEATEKASLEAIAKQAGITGAAFDDLFKRLQAKGNDANVVLQAILKTLGLVSQAANAGATTGNSGANASDAGDTSGGGGQQAGVGGIGGPSGNTTGDVFGGDGGGTGGSSSGGNTDASSSPLGNSDQQGNVGTSDNSGGIDATVLNGAQSNADSDTSEPGTPTSPDSFRKAMRHIYNKFKPGKLKGGDPAGPINDAVIAFAVVSKVATGQADLPKQLSELAFNASVYVTNRQEKKFDGVTEGIINLMTALPQITGGKGSASGKGGVAQAGGATQGDNGGLTAGDNLDGSKKPTPLTIANRGGQTVLPQGSSANINRGDTQFDADDQALADKQHAGDFSSVGGGRPQSGAGAATVNNQIDRVIGNLNLSVGQLNVRALKNDLKSAIDSNALDDALFNALQRATGNRDVLELGAEALHP